MKRKLTSTAISQIDWQFSDADTKYLTHAIHRYSGKFIPQVARQAIELITAPGDIILDVYVGSGTTLLEAALTGRQSIGIDLSPLAVMISKVKTTRVPLERTSAAFSELRQSLGSQFDRQLVLGHDTSEDHTNVDIENDQRLTDDWYCKWFQGAVLEQLVSIDLAISQLGDESCKRIAQVALSDILRRSSNAKSGYPNVMFDKKRGTVALPWGLFEKRFQLIANSVAELPDFDALVQPQVTLGDATKLELGDCSIDAVVTHPPYIGSIPYAEYGQLSLKWFGHDPKKLDRVLTGGRRSTKDVVDRFRLGYQKMFFETNRVLRSGGYLFLLIGSPTVKGERIDLAEMSIELAEESGFKLDARASRPGMNRRANLMGEETVLFFSKVL